MTEPLAISIRCPHEADMARLAARIAPCLNGGDTLHLSGPLGAGKSVFARALVRALLDDPDAEIPSPSFSLIHLYQRADAIEIRHVDLYRLEREDELDELGLEDGLEQAITLIEWPEHGRPLAGVSPLHIEIDPEADELRLVRVTGGPDWAGRLKGLQESRR